MFPSPNNLPTDFAVGVSGGIDSMTLLTWLLTTHHRPALVLHVHHHLRPEADLDCELVTEFCRRHGLKFHRLDVAVRRANSVQQQARQARYGAMIRSCLEHGLTDLVTAHHLDDARELAYAAQMSGRQAESPPSRTMPRWGIRIHRPLSDVSRQEIKQYAERHKVSWREDASNADPKYLRARLRQTEIPATRSSIEPTHDAVRIGVDALLLPLSRAQDLRIQVSSHFPHCSVSKSAMKDVEDAIQKSRARTVSSHGVTIWVGEQLIAHQTLAQTVAPKYMGELRWSGHVAASSQWRFGTGGNRRAKEFARQKRLSAWYREFGPIGWTHETPSRPCHHLNVSEAAIDLEHIKALEF